MSRYIHQILLILLMCTLAACSHKEEPFSVSDSHLIEFGIMDELVVDSKAAIDGTNYQQSGFIALGAWEFESWENDVLFGINGTEVRYTAQSGWNYSPKRYWQKGTYDFAGVMPSSLFAPSHRYSGSSQTSSFIVSLDDDTHDTLTLDFGDNGYNLAEGQHDLMVAFDDNVDNSNETMGTVVSGKLKQVSFKFEHQFSLVTIKAANLESNTNITIEKIQVYGNHTTIGDMVIIHNAGKFTSDYDISGDPTSEKNVYKTMTRPTTNVSGTTDWVLAAITSGTTYETLVPGLLVLPEECTFNIIVTYKDHLGKSYTKAGSLDVEWEIGKMYTYTFTISLDKITFAEPIVEPWPSTSQKMDTDIEM